MPFLIRYGLAAVGLSLVVACSGNKAAPVADRTLAAHAQRDRRIVVAGDTLYSIAWEAGRDYQEIARWNRIAPPYRLQPGQVIKLTAPRAGEKIDPPGNAQAPRSPRDKPLTAAPKPSAKPLPRSISGKPPSTPAKPHTQPPVAPFGLWAWPTAGKVIGTYSANTANKGIDIAGTRAQAIRAAASGKVVYAGSGLRGYGQLIILKHSEDFLSAYAHNDKIYVKEGDVIKQGQQIAEMGSSGADRVKLHFEIRQGGVPVDPLQFLPKQ